MTRRHMVESMSMLAMLLVATLAQTSGFDNVELKMPDDALRGKPIPVEVTLDGSTHHGLQVRLYYRSSKSPAFRSQILRRHGAAYKGEIPAAATWSPKLDYYVEATRSDGSRLMGFGSATAAFTLTTNEPVPEKPVGAWKQHAIQIGMCLASILGLFALSRNQSRRRRIILDQLFWVRTLMPLMHLTGNELREKLAKLSDRTLNHPIDGLKVYPVKVMRRKYSLIRKLDKDWFLQQTKRYLRTSDYEQIQKDLIAWGEAPKRSRESDEATPMAPPAPAPTGGMSLTPAIGQSKLKSVDRRQLVSN